MKRLLFYDRQTGEILHAHYEVHVVDGRGDEGAQLSASAADLADDALAELQSRGLDLKRLERVATSVVPQSSTGIDRTVDVKTGKLRSRRRELAEEAPGEAGK
jgi:hypothetical protein